MALSTGQVHDAYVNALGRSPTGDEIQRHTSRGELEGSPGQNQLIRELGGTPKAQSPEQIVNDMFKAEEESIKRQTEYITEQYVDNPFAFDEVLARQSSKAEYEPYYSELLDDYLTDVSMRRETVQDEKKLLTTLYQTDKATKSRAYDRAVSQAEQGFAGQGMFFSGIKKRKMGQAEVEYGAEEGRAGEVYGGQQRGYERELTGLATGEERKRRDIFGGDVALGGLEQYGGRQGEYQTAMESGVEQRRGEQYKQYLYPIESGYRRQFPSGTLKAEDYMPSSYLQYKY